MPTKRTFVRLLFLKLNQGRNTKKQIFGGVFYKNQKRTFLEVQIGTSNKSSFKFVFQHLFFNEKEVPCQFSSKIINCWAPWNFFFFYENFDAHAPKFWNLLLKSYLTFGYLTCSVRKKNSTLLYTYITIGNMYNTDSDSKDNERVPIKIKINLNRFKIF